MKLLYAQQADAQGRHMIYHVVYDRDRFAFSHTTTIPLVTLEIDEISENQALCRDLARSVGKVDADGEMRFCIDSAGNVIEKEGWEEAVEDV